MSILETARLCLREFVAGDLAALAAVISDPETMRFYPAPYDRSGVEEWINRNQRRYQSDGHGLWAMVLKSNGVLIGDCGLVRQEIDGVGEIEIGYHVRRDMWSQGFATEAARACRDYGFAHLPVSRLISLIRPENVPSRRVAEKNGMEVIKQVMWSDLPHLVYAIERQRYSGMHVSQPSRKHTQFDERTTCRCILEFRCCSKTIGTDHPFLNRRLHGADRP